MWHGYVQLPGQQKTLDYLSRHAGSGELRIIAGGTALLPTLRSEYRVPPTLVDITAIHQLRHLTHDPPDIRLGTLVTHNDVLRSALCESSASVLRQACRATGTPQIRTRGTIVGSVAAGSGSSDAAVALVAMDARVILTSTEQVRAVPLHLFGQSPGQTVRRPNELITELRFRPLSKQHRCIFLKLSPRAGPSPSVLLIAIVLSIVDGQVSDARIALGGLGPTVLRAIAAEEFLRNRVLTPEVCEQAGILSGSEAAPIDDVVGSARYRRAVLPVMIGDALRRLGQGQNSASVDLSSDVLLESDPISWRDNRRHRATFTDVIRLTVNGKGHRFVQASHKTLLQILREDAGLTGTKEGCGEGRCGSCTVWLNGQAVLACLVPGPQAHHGAVTTIEGLADGNRLHPVQQSFLEHRVVQCGFCMPGIVMAGAKLLAEYPHPTIDQARLALSGNLCRCTGYLRVVEALRAAGPAS